MQAHPTHRLTIPANPHEKMDLVIARLKPCFPLLIVALIAAIAGLAPLLSPLHAQLLRPQPPEEAGAALFRTQDCVHCHGEALEGTKKGPALADLYLDPTWTPDRITTQILSGGQKMPAFGEALTDDRIAQLVAFLRAKQKPPLPPPAPQP